MISMPSYHVASWRCRLPIERYGLKARQTNDYNYPNVLEQPKGVFAARFDSPGLFHHYAGDLGNDYTRDYRDLWRIDTVGLPTMHDPILGRDFVVILCDVSPDRIERVAHWDADEETWPLPSKMLEPGETEPPPPQPKPVFRVEQTATYLRQAEAANRLALELPAWLIGE